MGIKSRIQKLEESGKFEDDPRYSYRLDPETVEETQAWLDEFFSTTPEDEDIEKFDVSLALNELLGIKPRGGI